MMKPAAQVADPLFQIDNEVTRCIRQHARTHMKTEVCGVLIGEKHNGTVEVRASIEALNAAQAGTHVTFTQDAWETIYKVKDETYPDERIVGWYHSHPGFGVFLSEHDIFIHRNFFSAADQVAWVYDPHTDEEGCFGWVNGEIHRISNFAIVDNNGDGIERTPKETTLPEAEQETTVLEASQQRRRVQPAGMHWGAIALMFLLAMVLGFGISYFLYPRPVLVTLDPATGDLVVVPDEVLRRLEQDRMKDPGPGVVPQTAPAPAANTPAANPNPNSGGNK